MQRPLRLRRSRATLFTSAKTGAPGARPSRSDRVARQACEQRLAVAVERGSRRSGPRAPPMSATTPGRTLRALRSAGARLGEHHVAGAHAQPEPRADAAPRAAAAATGRRASAARSVRSCSSWRSTVASMMAPASARPVSGNRSSRCMISAVGPTAATLPSDSSTMVGRQPRHLGDRMADVDDGHAGSRRAAAR